MAAKSKWQQIRDGAIPELTQPTADILFDGQSSHIIGYARNAVIT
jgi:hypothetical protein